MLFIWYCSIKNTIEQSGEAALMRSPFPSSLGFFCNRVRSGALVWDRGMKNKLVRGGRLRVGSKKNGKEGFDGGCHWANRYKLPPLLPQTKYLYLELEKERTNGKWRLDPELLGRQKEIQNWQRHCHCSRVRWKLGMLELSKIEHTPHRFVTKSGIDRYTIQHEESLGFTGRTGH